MNHGLRRRICHLEFQGIGSFFKRADIQLQTENGFIVPCDGGVIDVCFQVFRFAGIFVFQNQRGLEGPVGGRKTGIFDGQIESGRVIQEGAKGQGGSFEPVSVA